MDERRSDRPVPSPRQAANGGRQALWALLGVAAGMLLPVLACGLLFLLFALAGAVSGMASGGTVSAQRVQQVHVRGPLSGPAVAIIEVNGPIVNGRAPVTSFNEVAAADDILDMLADARRDPSIKAVVLRINSPGGGVVPSDRIHQALQGLHKPVVVVMEDLAASGGYYIAAGADYIVANPATLTGSIGVISTFPEASELFEKLGVRFTVIKSGEAKDFGSPYRPMTPEERAYWQGVINEAYERFVRIVAEGRGMSEEEVRKLADGRVYTGQQALELGLVDELGYLDDGIAKAADLGGIEDVPRVVRYRRVSTFAEWLTGMQTSLASGWAQILNGALAPSLAYRWVP